MTSAQALDFIPRQPGRIRVAHVSDVHIQPERSAPSGAKAALDDVFSDIRGADVLLLGGDMVMSAVNATEERAHCLFQLLAELLDPYPKIPTIVCLGNQDIWGWNKSLSECSGAEPLFGKAMPMAFFGMSESYGVYDLKTWRVIVLDSIQPGGKYGFTPSLGDTQREWFYRELTRVPDQPTMIVSHVSVLPGPADFLGLNIERPKIDDWILPQNQVHVDGFELLQAVRKTPSVKLWLTAHTHIHQIMQMHGITFVSGPAVSGAWWRGSLHNSPPGYQVVDLFDDGTFTVEPIECDYTQLPH